MLHYSVSRPFGKYKRGDIIIDKDEIKEVLAGANRHDVVQVISKPEHLSGDFFRTNAELKEQAHAKAEALFKKKAA